MHSTLIGRAATVLGLAAIATIPSVVRAGSLGIAGDYNVFVLNNFTQSNTDVEGKVAVGNNATISSFSVASKLPANSATNFVVGGTVSQTGGTVNGSAVAGSHYTVSNGSISGNLYSGGNITQTGGSVQNVVAGGNYGVTYAGPNSAIVGGAYSQTGGWTPGNVTVGGNATLSGGASVGGHVQVNGNYTQSGGWVNGGVTHTGTYVGPSGQTHNIGPAAAIDTSSYTALPLSFTDAATYLTDQSSAWNALATTGTIAGSSGQLLLTGLDASLNVFNLTASQLTTGFTFKLNVPAGSTTLINVAGSAVNLGPFGFEYTGADAEHVLFNLAGATSVNMQGIGLLGTLLAPNADVNFVSGNIDGSLIARNLSGYGESHLHLFQGYIPPGTFDEPPPPPGGDTGSAVPLPASALGGMVLMGVLATRRQRRSM